jgi:hypothetical protein
LILHTFSLSPETLRKYLLRSLKRFQVYITISFLLFGLYLAWFAGPVHWPTAIIISAVIALAYFLIIFFNYRQQIRLLYSVRIELDGSGIIYHQLGAEPLRISRADVVRVQEREDGLWIETVDPRINMLVPLGLSRDGDEVVRLMLKKWASVEPLIRNSLDPHRWLRIVIYLLAILILLFANTLWIIIPLSAAVFVYGVYAERRLARVYDFTPGVKRMYSMAFSFLIFVITMKSCIMLTSAMIAP